MFRKIQIALSFLLIIALFTACFSTKESDQKQMQQLEDVNGQLAEAKEQISELEQERGQLQEQIVQREQKLSELEQEMESYKMLAQIPEDETGEGTTPAAEEQIREYQKELETAKRRQQEIKRELADLQSQNASDANNTFSEVDSILEELPLGNAAFEAPKRMTIGDKSLVKLIISRSTALDTLLKKLAKDTAGMAMKIGGKKVKLHTIMRARLNGGSGIAIRPLSEEEVAIGSQGDHEWVWEIEAKETGKQILRLQLYAIFKVQDKERANEIKTFEESIEVEVSALYEVKGFIAKNWQWLWAAILLPVASSLFAWWKRKTEER